MEGGPIGGGGTTGEGTPEPTFGAPREGGGGNEALLADVLADVLAGDEPGMPGAPGTALRGRAGASSLLRPSRRPSGVVPIGLAAR